MVDVVRMNGTPESMIAVGNTLPDRECSSWIGFAVPLMYKVIARTSASQKRMPWRSCTRVEYLIWLGSGTSCAGCRPMPSIDGTAFDPGRSRESEKKRDEGANPAGVIPKRLEDNGAPSRTFPSVGAIDCAMTEFKGRARPRMPLNSCSSGSETTLVAAAAMTRYGSRGDGR
jgi:hypothetical protein